MSELLQINYVLFQDVNVYAGQSSWVDALMIFCANMLIFCLPLLLLLVWGWPSRWRRGMNRGTGNVADEIVYARRRATLWVIVACGLAYALNLTWEQVMFEPRPFVSHKVHLLISHAADASFPSDHTAWAFAVLGMLAFCMLPPLVVARKQNQQQLGKPVPRAALLIPVLLIIVALVIACSIGFARVFVGVHYPGDILGGAIDGLLAAGIVTALSRWLHLITNGALRIARTLYLA
jgi:undecaprenyl-diphosphatase